MSELIGFVIATAGLVGIVWVGLRMFTHGIDAADDAASKQRRAAREQELETSYAGHSGLKAQHMEAQSRLVTMLSEVFDEIGLDGDIAVDLETASRISDQMNEEFPIVAASELRYTPEDVRSRSASVRQKLRLERRQRNANDPNIARYGYPKPKVVCPHCQKVGNVRVKTEAFKEVTRQTGLGAVIAPQNVTGKERSVAHCSNCDMQWSI